MEPNYQPIEECPGYNYFEKKVRLLDRKKFQMHNSFSADKWLRKAERQYLKVFNASEEQSTEEFAFEGLIYLWVVFNGWLSIIINDPIKYHRERDLVEIAGWDEDLYIKFSNLIDEDISFNIDFH